MADAIHELHHLVFWSIHIARQCAAYPEVVADQLEQSFIYKISNELSMYPRFLALLY
jgi:hypothetical protein